MVTQIHDTYAEHLQLLKYEVGEYYKTHHDYIPAEKGRARGVRILTMFLYLNDVEEGEDCRVFADQVLQSTCKTVFTHHGVLE